MSRLSKEHVYAALDKAGQHIIDAAGDDPYVSKQDIRETLQKLSGVEKELTEVLYRFLQFREEKPGGRITRSDVEETVSYLKLHLVDHYDLNNNGLSDSEIEKMPLTGKLAVRFARKLKEAAVSESLETEADILATLKALGQGLFFPAWANESDAKLTFFHQEASLNELTPSNFAATLGLDTSEPAEEVYIFEQGQQQWQWIVDQYEDWGGGTYWEAFQTLLQFMNEHLSDLTHLIIGRDGTRGSRQYPVYFIGLTAGGSIAGFRTYTVWT